jgi:phosphotransacetylase
MRVAVVNATTPLVLESVQLAYDEGLVEPVLIGSPRTMGEASEAIEWDISGFDNEFADDERQAADIAVALAANGEASGLMKGDVRTDVLMRAVLNRSTGLCAGQFLSHVFHMTVPGSDMALCISDAVLNVAPTLDQKARILRNAISLLSSLGNAAAKVAILSASESESAAMPSTVDAAELARMAEQGAFPGAIVDGPLAFDLAVSAKAAKTKGFESTVAGDADLLLVPNIETGNALFKMMVHFMSAAAAGIVLGAKVPIVLTSRADPVAARLASVALASIYSSSRREG